MTRVSVALWCVLLGATLSACGGGGGGERGGGGQPSQLAVTPSLGMVTNYRIDVFSADGESLLGSTTVTDDVAPLVAFSEQTGPVVVAVTALADALYFDEALGTTVSLPEGRVLHALASAADELAVTPLTELAYQLARVFDVFPLTENAVKQVNTAVQQVLAPGLSDVLLPPTVLGAEGVSGLAEDPAGAYGLVLAALAYLSDDDAGGRPALASLDALVADIADGKLDHFSQSDFSNALQDAAADYGYNGAIEPHVPVGNRLALQEVEGSSSTADACSALAGIAVGTRYQTVYYVQEPGNNFKTIFSADSEVVETTEFNGHDVAARESDVQVSWSVNPETVLDQMTLTEYLSAAEQPLALDTHGELKAQSSSDPFGNSFQNQTLIVNTPAFRQRYDLQRGESYSQTYDRSEQISVGGIPAFFSTNPVTQEITYLGRETIKVPAGTFETCRFHIYSGPRQIGEGSEVDTTDEVHDYWLAVGSGVLVLRLDDVGDELARELHSLSFAEADNPVTQ